MGSSSSPSGPMSSDTFTSVPSAARLAMATAAETTSSTVCPVPASLGALEPKVLAQMIWLPASMYSRKMEYSRSGLVRLSRSGLPPGGRPLCCSTVPMAPSQMVILSRKKSSSTGFSLLAELAGFS